MVMPTRKLGSQGLQVSAIGLGCMSMSQTDKPQQEMIQLLHTAIDSGVTFLDTSDVYGSNANELLIGQYYIAPTGQRLRSKNEVVNFLGTGSKKKKASQSSDDVASEGSAPPSKKKTVAKKKVHSVFTFDFKNPPEKVTWCLNDPDEDEWTPVIADWTVPVALKQEWANVFNHVAQS